MHVAFQGGNILQGRFKFCAALAAIAAVMLPVAASASVSPGSIDFGEATSNHIASVTITNDSQDDNWIIGTPTFDDGSAYSVYTTNCSFLFNTWPVNECDVVVSFNAHALDAGTYSDTLRVPHSADGGLTWEDDVVQVTGLVDAHDFTPPSVPQGLQATATTPTGTTLGWTPSSDDTSVAGYYVFEKFGLAWGTLAVAPVASYAITGLSPGSTHTYAVEAYDSAGNTSDMSDPITVTTPVPPAAPQNVVATPATGSVTFSWDPDPAGSTAFYLVQKLTGGVWTTVATQAWPATGATVTGLTRNTTYSFQVLAEDANLLTSDPVAITATTLDDTSPPTSPHVTASAVTSGGAHLHWTAATDDIGVAGYQMSVFEDGGWVPGATVSASATDYTVTGLLPGSAYVVGVTALDAKGNRSIAGEASFTTGPAPRFSTEPVASFVAGSTATNALVPVRTSWATVAANRCKTEVGRSTTGGAFDSVTLSNPLAVSYDWKVGYKLARAVRVQVSDCAGTPTGFRHTPAFTPLQLGTSAVVYGTGWSTTNGAAFLGGSERYTAHKNAVVTVKLTHVRAVAFVASCSATRGSARVALDGKNSATVSEHCAAGAGRVLYTHRWESAGNHTLKLTVLSAKRFDADGFIVM